MAEQKPQWPDALGVDFMANGFIDAFVALRHRQRLSERALRFASDESLPDWCAEP